MPNSTLWLLFLRMETVCSLFLSAFLVQGLLYNSSVVNAQ